MHCRAGQCRLIQPKQKNRHAAQADELATSCDDSRCNMGPGNAPRQPRQIDWQLVATMADATRAGHCSTAQPWAVDWHATTRSGSQQQWRQVQPGTRKCKHGGKLLAASRGSLGCMLPNDQPAAMWTGSNDGRCSPGSEAESQAGSPRWPACWAAGGPACPPAGPAEHAQLERPQQAGGTVQVAILMLMSSSLSLSLMKGRHEAAG